MPTQTPIPPYSAELSEMIAYYQQVDAFLKDEIDRLRPLPFAKAADAAQSIRFLAGHDSLDSLGFVPIDGVRLSANFRAIVDLLLTSSPDNPLALALDRQGASLAALDWSAPLPQLESSLTQWAAREGLDEASLQQLLQWALSPFRRLAAERYAEELRRMATNEKFTCPICGGYPDIAVLDDQEYGRRYLHCLCCDWQWPFKRMGCGYCGNDDHNRLSYLVVDNLKGYKLYCCEDCKSYLKTFDQRDGTSRLDRNPLLEHVKTLVLDLLAAEQGYLPLHP